MNNVCVCGKTCKNESSLACEDCLTLYCSEKCRVRDWDMNNHTEKCMIIAAKRGLDDSSSEDDTGPTMAEIIAERKRKMQRIRNYDESDDELSSSENDDALSNETVAIKITIQQVETINSISIHERSSTTLFSYVFTLPASMTRTNKDILSTAKKEMVTQWANNRVDAHIEDGTWGFELKMNDNHHIRSTRGEGYFFDTDISTQSLLQLEDLESIFIYLKEDFYMTTMKTHGKVAKSFTFNIVNTYNSMNPEMIAAINDDNMYAVKQLILGKNLEDHKYEALGARMQSGKYINYTVLMYAIHKHRVSIIKFLIQQGAHLTRESETRHHSKISAFYYAVSLGHSSIVRLFLATQRLDMNIVTKNGTALMEAVRKGYLDIVNLFMSDKRANVTYRNIFSGKSAFNIAIDVAYHAKDSDVIRTSSDIVMVLLSNTRIRIQWDLMEYTNFPDQRLNTIFKILHMREVDDIVDSSKIVVQSVQKKKKRNAKKVEPTIQVNIEIAQYDEDLVEFLFRVPLKFESAAKRAEFYGGILSDLTRQWIRENVTDKLLAGRWTMQSYEPDILIASGGKLTLDLFLSTVEKELDKSIGYWMDANLAWSSMDEITQDTFDIHINIEE